MLGNKVNLFRISSRLSSRIKQTIRTDSTEPSTIPSINRTSTGTLKTQGPIKSTTDLTPRTAHLKISTSRRRTQNINEEDLKACTG